MENKLSFTSRILLIIGAIALVIVIFVPIWRIDLDAPQYPEGLTLTIHANGLKGNVAIINGLNHYIGMKTLHNEDFIEFSILPYCIIFFAMAFLAVALLNKRKWLTFLFVAFVLFGVIAMFDFWKWEYNYGHHLDPDAAIIIPGMSYQPPLIGFKQLLNFGANSIPAIGGWIFVTAGLILLFRVIVEWRLSKRKHGISHLYKAIVALFLFSASSCNSNPQPIVIGKDICSFCKMTVSDNRFGAEVVTKKGKVFIFDDAHCVHSWLQQNNTADLAYFFTDFSNQHALIKAGQAVFLKSDALKSPMGGNTAAFSNIHDLTEVMKQVNGTVLHWNELRQP
ncbi:MAG: nitrous oxide reductase accessory protein NosL [Bacteroidota bacterium]